MGIPVDRRGGPLPAETLDDLQAIRAEIDNLLHVRTTGGLSVQEHRRYEALLLREAELLTCRRPVTAQRGATVIEYAMVVAMFAITAIAAFT